SDVYKRQVLFLAPWVHGSIVLSQAPRDTIDGPAGIDVAILQPNTSREIKWDPRYREIVIDDLLRRTREAGEKRPDLIVWPETAVPMVLLQEPVYLAQVEETVRAIHTPLLAGTLDYERTPDGYLAHNSAALFGADGRLVDRYDKQRLVPFSERMPFQKQAPWLSSLNFGQSDFSPGSRYVLFPVERARIGVLICFESIFPELAQRFVAHGANLLVNITNDFWFGDTAAPVQHAEMAIFRAVETRTPLLRCANTGISMVVDPWGRVSHQTRTFVEARIDVRVRTVDRPRPPFHVRHGAWLTIALTGLGGGLLGAAFLARGGSTA
ncbi:MAG: apolipoprotein N-acyltransferase, partial [Candidatus Eisenbacteria bacterium]|nr:apolipoprotein N-acyltransferase [Candidatus Eisenbacteria bacterium]